MALPKHFNATHLNQQNIFLNSILLILEEFSSLLSTISQFSQRCPGGGGGWDYL